LHPVVLHNEDLLVKEMQQGSEEAFTTLYNHYGPRLYLNILRMVKDDLQAGEIVQELFTRIWQKRTNKGIGENFEGYIYRVAQNLVYDFFRKLKRDHQLLEKFRALAEENYEYIEEGLQLKQHSHFLHKAIEQLPPQQKKVYELIKLKGCTYKKTAEIMGISPLTVKEYVVALNKSIRHYILTHTDAAVLVAILLLMNAK
jgi:RNA polymerase sigma factor (sigma-70 family)